MSLEPKTLILLVPIIIIALYFLLKYPEVSFALFISAYVLKGGINIGYFNLTAILLIITILGFLFPVFKGKKFEYHIKAPDLWFFLFMIILIAGILWSPDYIIGIKKTWRVFVLTFTSYFIARLFLTQIMQIKRFLSTLLISASLIGIILMIKSYLINFRGGRLQFFEANPIPEASLLGMGVLIAIISVIENSFQNRWIKWLIIGLIPVLFYGILLTGSRGPLVSTIIAIIFYLLIKFRERPKFVFTFSILVAMLFLIIINFNILSEGVLNRFNPLNWIDSESSIERISLYKSRWETVLINPLIGEGTGSIYLAENIFLEIFAEIGLIGLIVFIMFIYFIAKKGFLYLFKIYYKQEKELKSIGLIIIVITIALFIDKQVSYELAGDKDLFAFLGIIINLPFLKSKKYDKHVNGNNLEEKVLE
jgi:O-antigen ligase